MSDSVHPVNDFNQAEKVIETMISLFAQMDDSAELRNDHFTGLLFAWQNYKEKRDVYLGSVIENYEPD